MHSRTCDARMHATHIHAHAGTSNAGTHLGEHRHTHIHALMRRRTRMYTQAHMHKHTSVHTHTHTHTYTYTHAHTYTHTNTRTHTYAYKHTCTHTNTRTHTCWQRCSTLRPIFVIRRITPTCLHRSHSSCASSPLRTFTVRPPPLIELCSSLKPVGLSKSTCSQGVHSRYALALAQ